MHGRERIENWGRFAPLAAEFYKSLQIRPQDLLSIFKTVARGDVQINRSRVQLYNMQPRAPFCF